MSVTPEMIQQLIASGLLGAQPQPQGGLMGAMNNSSGQLGANLLANQSGASSPMSVLGQSMLGAQRQGISNAAGNLQNVGTAGDIAMKNMQMRMMLQAYPLYLQRLGLMRQQGQQEQPGEPQQGQSDQSQQSGGPSQDPNSTLEAGLFGSVFGMPGAKDAIDVAKTQMANDPVHATQMELAKNAVTQDRALLAQAQQQGNPVLAQAANIKLMKDLDLFTVGQYNGNFAGLGGVTPQTVGLSTYSPQTGTASTGGVESPAPGALATRSALAAAEGAGKATAELTEVKDKDGNVYKVPISTLLGSRAPPLPNKAAPPSAAPSPPNAGAAPTNLAGIGPAQTRMLEGNAGQALKTNETFQTQAEGAKDMLAQVQTLRNAAGDFTPGKFAESKAEMLNYLNSANLITSDQKKALGSYQEGQKIAIQLQAAATKQLGSREAAQIFTYMGKSLPNLTLSQNGLEKVSAWQEGTSRYNIARAQQANTLAQANDYKGVNQVRDTWIQNSNPLFYVMASAKPDVRTEMLQSMGPQQAQKFMGEWRGAAAKGFAPQPNEYWGQ